MQEQDTFTAILAANRMVDSDPVDTEGMLTEDQIKDDVRIHVGQVGVRICVVCTEEMIDGQLPWVAIGRTTAQKVAQMIVERDECVHLLSA